LEVQDNSIVPWERYLYFVGRDAELESIRRKFAEVWHDHHRIIVHGLGGVGKTQFALEYLYRFRSDYEQRFWISGADRTEYVSGLVAIAEKINFSQSQPDLTAEKVAGELLNWLPKNGRWLLVVDNLDDVDVLRNLKPRGNPHSHVLITTRNANLNWIGETFEIPSMNEADATQLLIRRAKLASRTADIDRDVQLAAESLVRELGYLPLAVEQAARFICECHFSIPRYLGIYMSSEHRNRILKRGPGSPDYPYSVATTWALSLERLRERNTDAIDLLNLFAFLNPDEILLEFLEAGRDGLDEPVRRLLGNDCDFAEALSALGSFSMIRRFQEHTKIAIHRLVQAIIKDGLTVEERKQWRKRAVALSLQAFPWIRQKAITVHRRFRNQVMPCLTGPDVEESENTAELLSRVCWYLDCEAQFEESVPLWERNIPHLQQDLWSRTCPNVHFQGSAGLDIYANRSY
jgi:hypothetical protein